MVKVHCVSQQLPGGREQSRLDKCQRASLASWIYFQHFSTLLAFHVTLSTGRSMDTAISMTCSVSRPHHDAVLTTSSISTVNSFLFLLASARTRCIFAGHFSPTAVSCGSCAAKVFRCTTSWWSNVQSRYYIRGWFMMLRTTLVSRGHCLLTDSALMLYRCCPVSWRAHLMTSACRFWLLRIFMKG